MSRISVAAATFAGALLFAGTAMAGQCPKIMAAVDAALAQNPKITAEQMAQVKELRAQGEAQHKAGQHKESVESLNKAKEILGVM